MKTEIQIGDKVYQIEILEPQENLLKVKVNDKEYFFTKNELGELSFIEDFKPSLKETEIISGASSEKEIKSPLPGVISAIMVKKGEEIKPGQKLVTLISMKMENEIISEGYGKIKEVKVKENQFVKSGDVLIVLD
ncbi:MAG: acetyl-CoA carboxylase biotin carboxyl carrier protein subunit [Patescibacteria group bacterium]|nr:acetyl-CoA carboxylase biotin carboxyl carrier protein subunit [Patescibacteria group bacterium]